MQEFCAALREAFDGPVKGGSPIEDEAMPLAREPRQSDQP
jgi:hypothetical protein